MAEKKIITVVGATGAQGGGLVRAILNDGNSEFTVRAITRDSNSDKANALRNSGAEVVTADVGDLRSMRNAFKGSYGVFCVTFYWEHFSPEKEKNHAKTMAAAAGETGVKHVIWSSLEDTRRWVPLDDYRMPTLMDKYKVPHFDAKGESEAFFTNLGLPVTILRTSFYWDNFINFGMGPQRGADGTLSITFPMADKKLPGIAAEDIGKCAYGIFTKGNELINRTVGIAGEHLTGYQMADVFSRVLGQQVNYNDISPDVYRGLGFDGADDLGNMFQFKRDFEEEFCGARDIEFTRSLNPELQSFEQWLVKNKTKIPVEMTS